MYRGLGAKGRVEGGENEKRGKEEINIFLGRDHKPPC
jgi:hypothetical protein